MGVEVAIIDAETKIRTLSQSSGRETGEIQISCLYLLLRAYYGLGDRTYS